MFKLFKTPKDPKKEERLRKRIAIFSGLLKACASPRDSAAIATYKVHLDNLHEELDLHLFG